MILLWGESTDRPMADVLSAILHVGAPYVFIDGNTALEIEYDHPLDGIIRVAGRSIPLEKITAAYLRPYEAVLQPATQLVLDWAELTPARVINRPSAMASNASKPYQLRLISTYGFCVPETLVTTDIQAVREFSRQHGKLIYKSISGIRSIVSHLSDEHLERLEDVRWCPTQFQAYVPGVDYRVHVVGSQLFGARIDSAADDYRYAFQHGLSTQITPWSCAPDLGDRITRLVEHLGLAVAGVDLRRSPDGNWYCFEVNPSPGFTYFAQYTGQAIHQAIARLLTSGALV